MKFSKLNRFFKKYLRNVVTFKLHEKDGKSLERKLKADFEK